MVEDFFTSPPYEAIHHAFFNSLSGFIHTFKEKGPAHYLSNLYYKIREGNYNKEHYRKKPGEGISAPVIKQEEVKVMTPKVVPSQPHLKPSSEPTGNKRGWKRDLVFTMIERGHSTVTAIVEAFKQEGKSVSPEYVSAILLELSK